MIYIHFDIEADGQTCGLNSMLQFGAAACDSNGKELSTFLANILPESDKIQDKTTMEEFWSKYPELFQGLSESAVSGSEFVLKLSIWLKSLNTTKFKWVAKPAAFDFPWVKFYYEKYKPADAIDIGYSSLCTSTLVWMAKQQKIAFQKDKFDLDHNALSDARVQSKFFHSLCETLKIPL